MSKEAIAALVSIVALIGVIFAAGQRMGEQTKELEHQRAQLATLSTKIDALTDDFNGTRLEMMRLLAGHVEPLPRRTP